VLGEKTDQERIEQLEATVAHLLGFLGPIADAISLRHREIAVQNQLAALDAELLDAETYITLAESFEGFLTRLHDAGQISRCDRSPARAQVGGQRGPGRTRGGRHQTLDPHA
jgi:hypothetical protein